MYSYTSTLKETLEKALALVAVTTTNHTQIGLTATDVRSSFASLYTLLKEYRSHEALALLVEDRKEQLRMLQGTEKKMIE
ncbi:hypothetical protein EON65_00800 [archaeon]|nr:MAG: hypothetical protein EON65_00800 [archaeon]